MSTTPRRPMTPDELDAVGCLSGVTYPVASWDKRFARSMIGMETITDKEAPQVWRLLWRYRRQMNHPRLAELLRIAQERSAPDLRKLAAQQREKDRIEEERRKYSEAMNRS